jgi:hypothetical protein
MEQLYELVPEYQYVPSYTGCVSLKRATTPRWSPWRIGPAWPVTVDKLPSRRRIEPILWTT